MARTYQTEKYFQVARTKNSTNLSNCENLSNGSNCQFKKYVEPRNSFKERINRHITEEATRRPGVSRKIVHDKLPSKILISFQRATETRLAGS